MRGGTAAKYGIRYEDRWCAYCALRVLAEEASAIHIEPPGPEYEGFEFTLETPIGVQYHQAKRQKTGEGRWTLDGLADAGVLRAFFARLHDAESSCTFVSAHAAAELDELSDRARKADSASEFISRYLDSTIWKSHLAHLAELWGIDQEWTWQALRRISIRTVDEKTLGEQLDFEVQMRLAGPAESAAAVLVEVLRDNVNRRLTADDLWTLLKERADLRPNPLSSQELGAVALAAANERFGRSRERDRIGGRLIPRGETNMVREALEKRRIVLVQGAAGMGKSEVLSDLRRGFEEEGHPHLFMRLDRLKAGATAREVGDQLGLSGAPPVVLAAVAAGSPSFLVVDQLDAISTTSGRNPEFLDAVEEMLRLALVEPQMRIVIACRSFDAGHDSRLRQIVDSDDPDSTVTVGPLSVTVVRETLEDLGIDPAALDSELIGLCSVPLHLYLMSQISTRDVAAVRRLKTLNDLFDAYWDDKQEALQSALGRDPRWTDVLDALVDRMSDEPALEAPRTTVDALKRDVDAMLSASVLIEEGEQIAFFHETFFDYAFARRFSARGRTLEELLAVDQLLFRRAQVRQILARGREGDPRRYEEDLAFLLLENSVRFHLKDLVLAWLQTVEAPRDHEWELIEALLDGDPGPLADRAWITLNAPAWFEFLDDRGILAGWLGEEGVRRERGLHILASSGPDNGDRVARLLGAEEHQDEEGSDTELEAVIRGGNLAGSRELFKVLLSRLEDGSDLGRRDFWYLAQELPEERPEWACELLGSFLKGRMDAGELIVNSGEGIFATTHMVRQGLHLREFVTAAAKGAPRTFVDEVLPVMFRIIEATGKHEDRDSGLRTDPIWGYRYFGDTLGELEEDLFLGAELAVRGLAQNDPEHFRGILEAQAETPFQSVACLLYVGLAANPPVFAQEAVDFLTTDPRRLRVGYTDSPHWNARTLLAAIVPELPDAAMARVEQLVLSYYTPWEKSVQSAGRQHGLAQFELLQGIPDEHRTSAMTRRLRELERKFGRLDFSPRGVQSGVVGSPIPESNARKMNDANWRRAMKRYADEERDRGDDFLKGGARELANVLEGLCGEDPIRFIRLAEALPDEVNTAYFDAILRGVANSENAVPLPDAEALVRRCHAISGRPCGQWIGHPLRSHLDGDLSAEMFEILSWYAIEGEGASTIEVVEDEPDNHLLSRGLNSVRGGMAYELARLIHARPSRIQQLRPALESLCRDESPAVRAMAAETVIAVGAHDPDYAVELFLELTKCPEEALLATRFVRQFMVYFGGRKFSKLGPLIERMVRSPLAAVRKEGAAQAALAALTEAPAQPLADACIAGTPELRLGATRVFAHNLHTARYRSLCEERLRSRFDDDDQEVRKAAAEAIQKTSAGDLAASSGLIEEFLGSRSFEENLESVLFALEDAPSTSAGLLLSACERVLGMLESPDEVTRKAARVGHQVSDLLLRGYVNAASRAEKDRALDVIDQALKVNAYGTHRALLDHDRG